MLTRTVCKCKAGNRAGAEPCLQRVEDAHELAAQVFADLRPALGVDEAQDRLQARLQRTCTVDTEIRAPHNDAEALLWRPDGDLMCNCEQHSCCTSISARSFGAHLACSSARACLCRGPTTSGWAVLPVAGRPDSHAAAARACACRQIRVTASAPAQCTANPVKVINHRMQSLEATRLVHLPGLLGSNDFARALHVTPGSSLKAVGGTIERLQYRHVLSMDDCAIKRVH